MHRRSLFLLAVVTALLLSACSRQTEVAIEVDLLSLAPADDRSSVLSLSAFADVDRYLGGDGDGASPDGGLLVDLGDVLANELGNVLTHAEVRIGFDITPDADVERFRIALYLGAVEDADDVYVPDNLWGDVDLADVAAEATVRGTLRLEASAGDIATADLFAGRFRLGIRLTVASEGAQAGDELTLVWTEGLVSFAAVPGGLLP